MRRSILLAMMGGTALLALAAHAADGEDREATAFGRSPTPPAVSDQPPGRPGGKRQGLGGSGWSREMSPRGMGNPKRGGETPGADSGSFLRPQEIDAFLAFCRQHFPPLHDQLTRARQADPRAFRQMLRQVGPPMTRLMRLWREDPAEADRIIRIQKIEMALREQRQRYHHADSEQERAAVREDIRNLLQERFDLRLARLKNDVDKLRHRLDEQTRRLTEQEQRKPQIVEEEFAQFLARPQGIEKGPRPHRPGAPDSQPAVDQVSELRQ